MSKNGKLLFRNYDPYITSPFGWRIHPIYHNNSFHAGVDYGTNGKKLNCYALENGKVVGTGFDKSCGNYVYVNYPRLNHNAIYQHLDSIKVKNGQSVNKDTIIGITGETGDATGIHLHFGWFPSANQNKAWNDKGWEDFEKYNYEEEKPLPINPTHPDEDKPFISKFNIGDDVIITGNLYVSSDATKATGYVKNKTTKITRIAKNAKHPYNTTNDLGWMDEKDIKLVNNGLPNPSTVTYVVQKGDTLSAIAKKYGTTWQKIYEKNKSVIGSNPNFIKPGQKLVI